VTAAVLLLAQAESLNPRANRGVARATGSRLFTLRGRDVSKDSIPFTGNRSNGLKRCQRWIALVLLIALGGCAARTTPSQAPAYPVTLSTLSEEKCQDLAKKEAAAIEFPSLNPGWGVLDPGIILVLPLIAIIVPVKRSAARRTVYESALQPCLETVALINKVGEENREVAHSLHGLGVYYGTPGWHAVSYGQAIRGTQVAEAEQLYKQALAIRERVLGPEHPEVAETLEAYASLLERTDRRAEANLLADRAHAIRAKGGQN